MRVNRWVRRSTAALMAILVTVGAPRAVTLEEQNAAMLEKLQQVHGLSGEQMAEIRAIFRHSGYMGQGNPAIARHAETGQECLARLEARGIRYAYPDFERICSAKHMAPLYDPASNSAGEARACIDQFEFPNIPCEYPVVWVRAREAAEICAAQGKRLCDAHEWEGACAGALQAPDYRFDLAKGVSPAAAVARMAQAHNAKYGPTRTWSYGPDYRKGICAAGSSKTPGCNGGGWNQCGSNTYPGGAFPDCSSSLGVYDLHGNAAEHMNLPLEPGQMTSLGSRTLGYTEMKGSWFIFDSYRAHPDWCRWRAPFWHGSRVMDSASHHNYHLGFRCCKSLEQ